jgi:predicted MPP superfamily phosphohydrolase
MWFLGFWLVQFGMKFFYVFFELAHDIRYLLMKFRPKKKFNKPLPSEDTVTSRREFIRQAGIIATALPFISIIQGIGWGRFRFTVHHTEISFKNLPPAFDGLRIAQLSDAHLGSFFGKKEKLEEVVEIINEIKPDLLLFTGDMVNNFAAEMDGYTDLWTRMKARMGKFSVLGNHDYGDYSQWPSAEKKKNNFIGIIRHQQAMGFDVLQNENRILELNGEKIYLSGTENWGRPPFKQYGDLKKAMKDIPDDAFTILMAHNPDQWTNGAIGDKRIDLTLSGHTHGFQIGIEIGNLKISPSRLLYKHWAGLYKEGDQYLYVNRGLGYLSFPGRVGIWPEITLLELRREG